MINLNTQKGPLYKQLADHIITQVISGQLQPGDKLSSARDFAVEVGVNPNTVIQTFQELERLDMTETKRGKGTFIRQDTNITSLRSKKVKEITTEYIKQLSSLGVAHSDILQILQGELSQ